MLRDAGVHEDLHNRVQAHPAITAEPLAKAVRAHVEIVAAKETASLAEKLRTPKDTVLVVGHSNTVPEIIKALGVQAPVALGDSDYDHLFIVILEPEPRLLRLRY